MLGQGIQRKVRESVSEGCENFLPFSIGLDFLSVMIKGKTGRNVTLTVSVIIDYLFPSLRLSGCVSCICYLYLLNLIYPIFTSFKMSKPL